LPIQDEVTITEGGTVRRNSGPSNAVIKALEEKMKKMHEFIHGSAEIDAQNPMHRMMSQIDLDIDKIISRPGSARNVMPATSDSMDAYDNPEIDLLDGNIALEDAISHLLGPTADDARDDLEVQALISDSDVREALRNFQENPEAAKLAMTNPVVKEKIDKLVATGAIAREQVAAINDDEVQEIFADPVIKQLLHDVQANPEQAKKALSDPELKRKFTKVLQTGLISKEKVAGINDKEIQSIVNHQQPSLLEEIEAMVKEQARSNDEVMSLMADPEVLLVLRNFHENPSAAYQALQDPVMHAKIGQLVQAGAISKEQLAAIDLTLVRRCEMTYEV
jgi:hypothetical protein